MKISVAARRFVPLLAFFLPLVDVWAAEPAGGQSGKSTKVTKTAKSPNPPKPSAAPAQPEPPHEIVLRHALSGAALDTLSTLVVRFNDQEAKPTPKQKTATARIVLEDAQGLADKSRLPHLALFDQDEPQTLFESRPRFLPLQRVMETGQQRFDVKQFYPQMIDAVDDLAGRMQALPIGMSLPVLFYNKAAFAKAGLDAQTPPKTWWELQEAAGALRDAGYACPLTSSRFAWVHFENVSSQHGEPILARDGKRDQLALNSMVNVKHIALLTSWHKSKYFVYSGPGREGDDRFAAGECAMLTGESALYARIAREKPDFPLGIAVLPHYDDVYGVKPAQVLPDGFALWVLAADKKTEQQAIARFMSFLLAPEVQREWVRTTGFLPMTPVAVQALREAGANPTVLDQAERRLSMVKRDAARTRNGFGRSRIRNILNEEIEFVWGSQKPPKEALDSAVTRSMPILGIAEPAKTTKR